MLEKNKLGWYLRFAKDWNSPGSSSSLCRAQLCSRDLSGSPGEGLLSLGMSQGAPVTGVCDAVQICRLGEGGSRFQK